MPEVIALATVALVGGLAGLFTWFAFAIRRDSQERFQRVRQQLERDANTVICHLFGRESTSTNAQSTAKQ